MSQRRRGKIGSLRSFLYVRDITTHSRGTVSFKKYIRAQDGLSNFESQIGERARYQINRN